MPPVLQSSEPASSEDLLAQLAGDAGAEAPADRAALARSQLDEFLRVNHAALSHLQQDQELTRLCQGASSLYVEAAVLRRKVWVFVGPADRCSFKLVYADDPKPAEASAAKPAEPAEPAEPAKPAEPATPAAASAAEPAAPDFPVPDFKNAEHFVCNDTATFADKTAATPPPFAVRGYMLARRPEEAVHNCILEAGLAAFNGYMSLAKMLVATRTDYDTAAAEAAETAAAAEKTAAEAAAAGTADENAPAAKTAAAAKVAAAAAAEGLKNRAAQVRELSDRLMNLSRRTRIAVEVPPAIAGALYARDENVSRLVALASATLEAATADAAFVPGLLRALEAGRAFEARATMLPSYCSLAKWSRPEETPARNPSQKAVRTAKTSFYDKSQARAKDLEVAAAVCETTATEAAPPSLLEKPADDVIGALVRELARLPRVFLLLEDMPAAAAAGADALVAGIVAHANATNSITVFSRCIGHGLFAPAAIRCFAALKPALRESAASGLVVTACKIENGFVCSARGEPRAQAVARLNAVTPASPFVFAEPALAALGEVGFLRPLPAARAALAEFVGGAPVLDAIFASPAPLFITGSAIAAAWTGEPATLAGMYPTHVFADPAAVRAWAAGAGHVGPLPPVSNLVGLASGRLFGELPGSEQFELVYGADVDIFVDTGAIVRARGLAPTSATHQALLDETVAGLFGRLSGVGAYVLRQVATAVSHRWQIVPVGRLHGRRCFEVYSSTYARTTCHHVAPVRGIFGRVDGADSACEFRLAASAIQSLHTRRLDDLNFFAGLRSPFGTIMRYYARGFELGPRLTGASPALAEAARRGRAMVADELSPDASFIAAHIPANC